MGDLVPASFRALVAGRPADPLLAHLEHGGQEATDGDSWLAGLPARVQAYLERWELLLDGSARHGACALVLPVLRRDGEPAALKLTWPHAEARHEHLALRLWNGRGAVRLLAADPRAGALLLERLDAEASLRRRPLVEACEVIGRLFTELDRPAPAQLDRLPDRAHRWHEQLASGSASVPRRLTEQARSLLSELLGSPGDDVHTRLVHEDLHDLNVLAPLEWEHGDRRGDWLAIDPKPVAAEWAYAVAPIVWNRADEAASASNLRVHVRLRADVVAETAGLDEERVRAWTFVRLVLNAVWAAQEGAVADDFRTRMIALAKAFAD